MSIDTGKCAMSILLSTQNSRWPYKTEYGREIQVSGDVLVVGSGVAGAHAAIAAAKKGAKVIAVDKANIKISGSGGTGVDHWHFACTNPCCVVGPDEMIEIVGAYPFGVTGETGLGPTCYVTCKESYDALLELEAYGATIRDVDDEFVGAEFRDEETKLMFAYDYDGKHTLRVPGIHFKQAMYRAMQTLGVRLCEHIMVTSLLTEGGEKGSRVVGATGIDVNTGAFYVFRAKATVLATCTPVGMWSYSTEAAGSNKLGGEPNGGSAYALGWDAGAEFTMMEASVKGGGGGFRGWAPDFGSGSAFASWYACTLVDADGKQIPWIDRDGRVLDTVSERYRAAPGQKFFLGTVHPLGMPYEYRGPSIIPDLGQRISQGEYRLPLFADLPSMPAHERRAIWGLMIGNEGMTRHLYREYCSAGFDPDEDQLEVEVLPFQAMIPGKMPPVKFGASERDLGFVGGYGGLVFDWDFKTSLDGLYAAGQVLAGGANYSASACSGRFAGRSAAEYSLNATEGAPDQNQLSSEKQRIGKLARRTDGLEWKEVQFLVNKTMQIYCAEYRSEEMLTTGLKWLRDIRTSEAASMYVRNPHELQRALECLERITVGEIIMESSRLRRSSSRGLDFKRLDFPAVDPPEHQKYFTVKLTNEGVAGGELPFNYWLLPPSEPMYSLNYEHHAKLG
jgi:succinate dehydrogenase/fumarate reductase flavoprotein subunit